MRARTVIMALAATLVLSGCIRDRLLPAFVGKDGVRLEIAGVPQFVYEENGCQMAFNADKREFRAHTDNMSDYFVVTLSKIPGGKDDQVTGSVTWTGDDYNRTLNNLSFEVAKIESGKIWLWNQANKLAIVIPVFN